jgi:predicted Zn-dependent protease
MYGARIKEHDKEKGYSLIRHAYTLDPNEKYLNYYYGLMLMEQDSIPASEKYFLKEKTISDYYECDFYLARVSLVKNDLNSAIGYLERYVTRDSMNEQANNNLLLLYVNTHQAQKAQAEIARIKRNGIPVPNELIQQAGMMH